MSKKLTEITSKFHDMMTENKPWQTIVNTNNLPKSNEREESSSPRTSNVLSHKESASYSSKVVLPKRFNIDDNGGGYLGL